MTLPSNRDKEARFEITSEYLFSRDEKLWPWETTTVGFPLWRQIAVNWGRRVPQGHLFQCGLELLIECPKTHQC
jgi:hypothetical protein